ncbi:hypothetical protein OG871_03680 [Kitasatospora sp. NBC_00374]|uniref:hypothetical protein n=1 Tax=Kitasatospora sp. NBC_00374 TaxID=2975964 RepID=UPI0030E2C9F0
MSERPDPRLAYRRSPRTPTPAGRSEEPTIEIGHPTQELTLRQATGRGRRPVEEATSATLLDGAVWGTPPAASHDRLTSVWRGSGDHRAPVRAPAGRRRRTRRWLLPAGVAVAVLGALLWQRSHHALAVTGVAVRSDAAGPGCDRTVTVTAALLTNGEAGTVDYRWLRSDGGVSGPMRQSVERGSRRTEVTLRWSFDGPGTVTATAELEVLSPGRARSATTFTYACR